jgi:hypothetical protein
MEYESDSGSYNSDVEDISVDESSSDTSMSEIDINKLENIF